MSNAPTTIEEFTQRIAVNTPDATAHYMANRAAIEEANKLVQQKTEENTSEERKIG